MNPLPSTSRAPNLRDYKINRILSKKTYIPRFPVSRNVTPKVKLEENAAAPTPNDAGPSADRRKATRFEKKLLPGAETFAPVTDTSRSRITIKSKPKIASSSSSSSAVVVKKEPAERGETCAAEIPTKSILGKFAQISSAPPQDLPVSVPRPPPVAQPTDAQKPISLLLDLFDPRGEESPLFILKTPKYLPALVDSPPPKSGPSKGEACCETRKCTMHDLPAGQIGTLQIMKSGRLRLVLGGCKFWLQRGVRVNFSEEVAYVCGDAETKSGEIANIGAVKDRIIAVPESVTVFADG